MSFDLFPWQPGVLDAAADRSTRGLVLMFPSQIAGKTELQQTILAHRIVTNPSRMIWVSPNVDPMASAWVKTKWRSMVSTTPALRERVAPDKSRQSDSSLTFKRFRGGYLIVAGANSPSGLCSHSVSAGYFDEVDRWPDSAGEEGDPFFIVLRRMEAERNSFWFANSTPTIKGFSRVERLFQRSDQARWYCPCPACGVWNFLTWDNVRWETPPDAPEDFVPENIWLQCLSCHARLSDAQRRAMVRAGQWRSCASSSGLRGFYLHGVNSLLPAKTGFRDKLHQMVEEFLIVKRTGESALRTWVNTFCAEPYESRDGQPIRGHLLQERAEDYSALPPEALIIVVGVDTQADRLEAVAVAYGYRECSWLVEKRVFPGDVFTPGPWAALDEWLQTPHRRADGVDLPISCALIDRGGVAGGGARGSEGRSFGRAVDAFTGPRNGRRVYSCYGNNTPGAVLVSRPARDSLQRALALRIGTDQAKAIIASRLRGGDPRLPGYIHFRQGHGFDTEFYLQLTSEILKVEWRHGVPRARWHKTRARNEALDCFVYALAALDVLKPNWDALDQKVKAQSSHLEVQSSKLKVQSPNRATAPASPRPAPHLPRPSGWGGGDWS